MHAGIVFCLLRGATPVNQRLCCSHCFAVAPWSLCSHSQTYLGSCCGCDIVTATSSSASHWQKSSLIQQVRGCGLFSSSLLWCDFFHSDLHINAHFSFFVTWLICCHGTLFSMVALLSWHLSCQFTVLFRPHPPHQSTDRQTWHCMTLVKAVLDGSLLSHAIDYFLSAAVLAHCFLAHCTNSFFKGTQHSLCCKSWLAK